MQGCDQANIRCPVIPLDLLVAVLPLEVHDGPPRATLKAPVDAVSFRLYFSEQIVVSLDMSAAGRSDLHEGELVPISRMLLEQSLNGEEPLQDSFGIVHPIDTHPEERRIHAQPSQQVDAFRVGR